MLGKHTRHRRTVALLVGMLLLAGVTAACQPARVGARCRTTDFGDDGAHWVLQCRSGRWQRLITKKQVVEIMVAGRAAPAAPGGGSGGNPDAVVAGSVAPRDDYPTAWRTAVQNSVSDSWGFPNRQCTSFLAWRLANTNHYALPISPGDARLWDDRLAPYAAVNGIPAVGAIAHWNENESAGGLGAGPLGHVAWVQAVYADGSVMIEQYNLGNTGTYVQMRTRAPRYIHVGDL